MTCRIRVKGTSSCWGSSGLGSRDLSTPVEHREVSEELVDEGPAEEQENSMKNQEHGEGIT